MQILNGKAIKNQSVDLDVKAIRKSGIFSNIEDWRYMNFATTKDMLRQAMNISDLVIRVKAVYTTNQSLTTCANTTDGVSIANGDTILLAGQTDKRQNGVYTFATGGALTRIATLNTAVTNSLATLGISIVGIKFHILQGNLNQDCIAYLASGVETPILGTDNIDIYILPNLKVSSASNNLITTVNDRIEVKLKNTGVDVFGGLKYDPITKEIYITLSEMPGAAGGQLLYYLGTYHSQPNIANYLGNVRLGNGGVGITDLEFGLQNIFGNGSDGDVTIASGATVTLTSNANYRNLIINEGGTLITNAYAVFATEKIINNGVIHCNGATPTSGATANGYTAQYLGGSGNSNISTTASLGGKGGGTPTATLPTAAQGGLSASYLLPAMLSGAIPSTTTKYTGGSGGQGTTDSGAGGGVMVISAKYLEGFGQINSIGGDGFNVLTGTKYGGGGGAILINTYSDLHNNSFVSCRTSGGRGNNLTNSGARGNVITNQFIDNILFTTDPIISSVSGVVRRNGTATITVTAQNISYLTDYELVLARNLWTLDNVRRTTINTVELTFTIDSSVALGTTTLTAVNKVRNNTRTSNAFTITIAEGAPFISSLNVNEIDLGGTSAVVVTGSGFDVGTTFSVLNNPGLTINTTTFNSANQMTLNVTVSSNEVDGYKNFQLVATNANGNSGTSGYNKLYGRYPYITIDHNTVGVRSYLGGSASDYSRSSNVFTRITNTNTRVAVELLMTFMKSLRTGFHDGEFTVETVTPPLDAGAGDLASKRYGYGEKLTNANGVSANIINDQALGYVRQTDGYNTNINIGTTERIRIVFSGGSCTMERRNSANVFINGWALVSVNTSINELGVFLSTYLNTDVIKILEIKGRIRQS